MPSAESAATTAGLAPTLSKLSLVKKVEVLLGPMRTTGMSAGGLAGGGGRRRCGSPRCCCPGGGGSGRVLQGGQYTAARQAHCVKRRLVELPGRQGGGVGPLPALAF